MKTNKTGCPQQGPATTSITTDDDDRPGGERWPSATPRVPKLVVVIEFEGRVAISIQDAGGDERQAEGLRAFIAADAELYEFCTSARRLRDRFGAE